MTRSELKALAEKSIVDMNGEDMREIRCAIPTLLATIEAYEGVLKKYAGMKEHGMAARSVLGEHGEKA